MHERPTATRIAITFVLLIRLPVWRTCDGDPPGDARARAAPPAGQLRDDSWRGLHLHPRRPPLCLRLHRRSRAQAGSVLRTTRLAPSVCLRLLQLRRDHDVGLWRPVAEFRAAAGPYGARGV